MVEALEKVVQQEHKIKKDDSIRDKKKERQLGIQRVLISGLRIDNLRTTSIANQIQRVMELRMLKANSIQIRITRIMERRDHLEDVLPVEGIIMLISALVNPTPTSHNNHLYHNNNKSFSKGFM